jgi:hypothetical protein
MDKRLLPFIVVIILVCLICLMVRQSQKQNLIFRPDPTAPNSVIAQLPHINKALAATKSLAEENAKAVIGAPRRPIRQPINLQEGRNLYDNLKAQTDGLISFLRSGLSTRFAGTDAQEIDDELEISQQKLSAFLAWTRQSVQRHNGPPKAGAADDPLKIGVDGVISWLAALRDADERAIEQLREQLLENRLDSWNDLNR